jgi:hypothetical protein
MVLKKNGLPPDSSYTTIDYISVPIAVIVTWAFDPLRQLNWAKNVAKSL